MESTTTFRDKIWDNVRHAVGVPVGLRREIANYEQRMRIGDLEPVGSVLRNVPSWHEWAHEPLENFVPGLYQRDDGTLRGVRFEGGVESIVTVSCTALATFGRERLVEGWLCDIRDIAGLSAGKCEPGRFDTLDAMAIERCPDYILDISPNNLSKMLDHYEIRIFNSETCDHFVQHEWDGRVFLSNAGGAHHFAAARYIAGQLGQQVPIRGRLYVCSLNAGAVRDLVREFEMFVVGETQDSRGLAGWKMLRAIAAMGSPYFYRMLPAPHSEKTAILLPRENRRAMAAARALRAGGIVDLGAYLLDLVSRQETSAATTAT